jgi:methionyl-tRNA formyltransferase
MILGAENVLVTGYLIDSNNFKLVPQNPLLASPAPKVTKELMQIDWEKPAIEIHNLVRGLSPYPGAFFSFKDKIIKVFKTKLVLRSNLVPKQIEQSKKTLIIGCGKDALEILELQLEGKKKLGIEEFLRGFSFL